MDLYATGIVFPEAPTWFDGALWVSDVLAGGVIRLSGNGDVDDRRLLGRRGIGGMVATADGRLLATGRDLVDSVTGDVITPRPEHSRGLNDVGTTLTGDLLVGVLNYRPLVGDDPLPGSVGRLIAGRQPEWTWWTGVTWPNGIGSLTDGTIVIADYATGTLVGRRPDASSSMLAASQSGHYDGLCIDDHDGLWLATGPGGAIEHRAPDGELIDHLRVPAGSCPACASAATPPTRC